ncbi:MAG: Gfo/Idh/MocA family oxidoreductase [Clostridia bacterium]|nr:Gfo/Idh/MocA family oxidoreductase [Clostridia bacterium]
MKTIRLGLIGCGNMMEAHASNINQVEGIEITVVCDIIPERAQKVAEALGNSPIITTDYQSMVHDIDAVLVALPHDLHYECGMFFARHKKHILMEKPLCNTEEECVELIRVCEEEDVTLMCGYPVPFMSDIVKLKELVDSGEFGKIIQMSIWTEQWTQGANEWHWGNTARLGGGQFFSHGCHYVDLLMRFLGNPVEGSHFGTRVGTPWLRREGTSVAIFKFENGALGYHGATWGAHGTKMGYDFQIMTEKGLLDYDKKTGEIRYYSSEELHIPGEEASSAGRKYKVLHRHEGKASKETHREISHFIDCVNHHKRPLTDGRAALQSLRIIWRMYDAEKNGTIADLRGLGLDNA